MKRKPTAMGMLHVYPTRTAGDHNVVRHRIPELKFPANFMWKVRIHSTSSFVSPVKFNVISSNS